SGLRGLGVAGVGRCWILVFESFDFCFLCWMARCLFVMIWLSIGGLALVYWDVVCSDVSAVSVDIDAWVLGCVSLARFWGLVV
ncbi:hypothetical protein AAHH79_35660, partial [Burkholderia pseudomallei]